jgi:hypothetical protein
MPLRRAETNACLGSYVSNESNAGATDVTAHERLAEARRPD